MSNANFGEQAANRNIVGGGALANLGTAQNADARANIGAQATMGGVLRDIQNLVGSPPKPRQVKGGKKPAASGSLPAAPKKPRKTAKKR